MRWLSLILLLALLSCGRSSSTAPGGTPVYYPPTVTLPEKRINNWSYGPHPLHTLDILLPRGRNKLNTKLLVLVHGGQWTMGDKSEMEGYITLMQSRLPDFAFALVNYRLANGSTIFLPEQQQDILDAISFLWQKADSLSISQKTALLGESAGGQLALVNAYASQAANIRAAIGIKSPSALVNWYNQAQNPQVKPLLETVTGGTPTNLATVYENSSPINFVTAGDPSTLLIHGESDGFVLTSQATQLGDKLFNCGVNRQVILFTGEAHAFTLSSQLRVYDSVVTFLRDPQLFR